MNLDPTLGMLASKSMLLSGVLVVSAMTITAIYYFDFITTPITLCVVMPEHSFSYHNIESEKGKSFSSVFILIAYCAYRKTKNGDKRIETRQ